MGVILKLWLILTFINPYQATSVRGAADWLTSQQLDNRAWSLGFDDNGDPGLTAEAVVALWASGDSIAPETLAYLENSARIFQQELSVGLTARLVFAAVVAGEDWRDFGGLHLMDSLLNRISEEGRIGESWGEHCLALNAAHITDTRVPPVAYDALLEASHPDGGWGITSDATSDTVTTAVCLQALAGYSALEPARFAPALDYLRAMQNADGGWPHQKPSDYSTASDAYSTAVVIMALNALDESLSDWGNPDAALMTFQEVDGGFRYQADFPETSRVLVTVQAIPALAGLSLLDLG